MTKFLHLIINLYFTIHFSWWKGDFYYAEKETEPLRQPL